jgi:hypothetical protein
MERQRIIVITTEEREYLKRIFKVSTPTVWAAVKYRKNNDIHKRIRAAAIERGNPEMVLAPEFDTIYLTNRSDADNKMRRYMVQTFENGATLEGCFDTGLVEVRDKRGAVRGQWKNPKVTEITAIQEVAMSL